VSSRVRARLSRVRSTRLSGEMAWVVIGQGLAAVGGLVGVRVLTGMLTPDRYGELALAITLATLGQLVAWSPITGAALRYFAPAAESSQLDSYLRAVRRLVNHATSAVMALACVLVATLVALGEARWLGLTLAALLFTVLSGYEAVLDNIQLASRQRRVVAWHQGVNTWLRFFVAALMISLFGESSSVAMVGFALAVLLVLASQLIFFHRLVVRRAARPGSSSPTDASHIARQLIQYAWPIAAWGVFTWMQAVSDRWILQVFTTTSVVGIYMVLYQVGFYPMTLLSTITVQFVSPVIFERAGDGSEVQRLDAAWRLIVVIVVISGAATAILAALTSLLHRPLFQLLVGAPYREASYLLPWMVCAGGLFAAGQAASQAVLVESTRRLLLPKAVIALMTLGLYVLGAHFQGLDGIIYANVIFGFVYFGWMLWLARLWRRGVVSRAVAAPTGRRLA
jgi:O-antigen/teichoic acid export membrane protein